MIKSLIKFAEILISRQRFFIKNIYAQKILFKDTTSKNKFTKIKSIYFFTINASYTNFVYFCSTDDEICESDKVRHVTL